MKPRASKIRAEKATKPLKRGELALLRGNPKRKKPIVEYVDKNRPVMDEYYALTERFQDQQIDLGEMKLALKRLISDDKYFLDSYIYLAQIEYEEENYEVYADLLWRAYLEALHLVVSAEGDYPESLSWGWLENRHILRALCDFALLQWEQGHVRLALEIYRKLLASNLNDNIGARYSILALRLGYKSDYEEFFLPDFGPIYGLDAMKMESWFNEHSVKFPEEFADFFKNAKQYA